MAQRWRVGEGGVRVINRNGSAYSLPPGAVLDDLPERYEGTLEVLEWDAFRKRRGGYQDKAIRPAEDK